MSNLSVKSEEILASARSLIVNGGYNGFSYADIAAVVGIRKASIHHHFPAKSDLVRTLVARYREEAEKGMTGLEQQVPNPPDLLATYAGYWAKCIADNSIPFCVCAMLASELPVLPQDVAREVTLFFRFLSKWLADVMERGAREGSLSLSTTPVAEAEAFMATVHGAMLAARAYGAPETFATVIAPTLKRLSIPSAP